MRTLNTAELEVLNALNASFKAGCIFGFCVGAAAAVAINLMWGLL